MKKIILALFLLSAFSIFSSTKLQELRPGFEELISTSMISFEKAMSDSFVSEFGKTYEKSFLVHSDTYTDTMMKSVIEPGPHVKELLAAQGDEAPADSSIIISLEEVEPDNFVLTLDADGNPEVIEGDFDYMKTFIPFLKEELKSSFAAN